MMILAGSVVRDTELLTYDRLIQTKVSVGEMCEIDLGSVRKGVADRVGELNRR